MENFTAIVPFRANSKGLPRKNFLLLNDQPLWKRAVLQAQRTCSKTIYSTDYSLSETDRKEVEGIYDRRPNVLATDDTLMEEVLGYLIREYELHSDNLVLLQTTSPLRLDEHIKNACELFSTGNYSMVMSVVEKDNIALKYGLLGHENNFEFINKPCYCFSNRQNLPEVFGPNGAVYVFNALTFLESNSFPHKNIGVIKMSMDHSLDIDSEENYKQVSSLL